MTCCTCKTGPGFSTPLAAFNSGVKEKLAYLPVTTATQTARYRNSCWRRETLEASRADSWRSFSFQTFFK